MALIGIKDIAQLLGGMPDANAWSIVRKRFDFPDPVQHGRRGGGPNTHINTLWDSAAVNRWLKKDAQMPRGKNGRRLPAACTEKSTFDLELARKFIRGDFALAVKHQPTKETQ